MKTYFSTVLVCLCILSFGQNKIDFTGIKEEPIFRSKEDSAQFAAVQHAISKSYTETTDPKRIDSLFKLSSQLFMSRVVGFRKVYCAYPDFIQYEKLNEHSNFSQIKELSISKGKFKSIPSQVFKCKNLEVLQLVNTSLSRLQRKVNRLPNLKMVILFNNKPTKSLKIKKNKTIETLVIRGEKSDYLPKSYKNLKRLAKLDLSNNALTEFPNGANLNKNLKELILINNAITLSENAIKHNPHIEKLDLMKNKVIKVPASIANLTNLKTLRFNYNEIRDVAPEINQLKKLENLSFYHNELTSIPHGVYQLGSLKEIDLYYNQIEKLEDNVINWQNLEILYLAFNKIYSVSDTLCNLPNLRELYLHNNRLSSLPEELNKLTNLKVLRINNNNLLHLPTSLTQLTYLENLDLSRNEIQSLPTDFFNFQHLKILALIANPWDAETKEMLPEKAKELRAKNVVVHLNSFDESLEN